MTAMIREIYEALKAAGAPDDKAAEAAEAMAMPEDRLAPIEAKIEELRKGQGELAGRMDALENRMDRLEGRMDKLEDRFSGMERQLAELVGEQRMLKLAVMGTFLAIITLIVRTIWISG